MYQKLTRVLKKLHRGQRGMTGLETAIILIAFVTVASVLAYSVLSAGIFSAERGKETVYGGLAQAQATLEVKGSVIGLADDISAATGELAALQFVIGLALPEESLDTNAIVVNYYDSSGEVLGITGTSANFTISGGSTERGKTNMIEGDEFFEVSIIIARSPDEYDEFTLELLPPKGAAIRIKRTLPGALNTIMNLQ